MLEWLRKKKRLRISINKARAHRGYFPYFFVLFQKQAERYGYKFQTNLKKKTDLVLVFHGASTTLQKIKDRQAEGAKVVQRVDGMWGWQGGTPESIAGHQRTKILLDVYEFADAVIYQSKFNLEIFRRFLRKPKAGCKEYVIYNGGDPELFSPEGPNERPFDYPHLLVTSSWHTLNWKGLDRTIEVFKHLGRDDCCLMVIGEVKDKKDVPRVKYLDRLTQPEMARVFRGADAFIYFPWFDWCPNNVIEAILSGLPVVSGKLGGQAELIGPSGIIVPDQPERTIENFYQQGEVDQEKAVAAINAVLENPARFKVPRPDLHIGTCIDNYFQAFREVLGWWEE